MLPMSHLDAWLPVYEFSELHARRVRAPLADVRRALHEVDLARLPFVRALMALRLVPAALLAPRETLARLRAARAAPPRLGLMALEGFALLADEPREIVLGVTGRFWRARGEILPSDAASCRDAPPPGAARAAMSFSLEPLPDGATRLATETRIHCADPDARRAFAWYWRAIRPGSGAIRRAMLRAIARAAERGAARVA
jgi:hypothetical protein